MIKGTIIALCLAFVVGCSNNPTQSNADLGQTRDAALVGTWAKANTPPDTIIFNSGGGYIERKENTMSSIIETGDWYTSYGTLYMQNSSGEQYKYEYEFSSNAIYLCTSSLRATTAWNCTQYNKQ
jgi:hypothetical protein